MNSLLQDAALDGHQGVVDFDEIVLAVLLQMQSVKLQLDDVVGVRSELPLDVGVGGVGTVGEARGLDLSHVVGLCMF